MQVLRSLLWAIGLCFFSARAALVRPNYGKTPRERIFAYLQMNDDVDPKVVCCGESALHKICVIDQNVMSRLNVTELDLTVIVEDFLQKGADVNVPLGAPYMSKWTPLHLASNNGHVGIVNVLLKHGADKEAKDYCNNTPLIVAQAAKILTVVGILKGPQTDGAKDASAAESSAPSVFNNFVTAVNSWMGR